MLDTETVTTRPPACGVADILPAESISAMIQPPKMSPRGLQSAGIASVREASSPFGSIEFRRLSMERIPPISRLRISDTYVASQYIIVNRSEKPPVLHIALRKF
jgi:hypothetical protein